MIDATQVSIVGLLFVIVSQQVMIHRLSNKIMSKNFADYQQSLGMSEKPKNVGKSKEDDIQPGEDLRTLQGFNL